MWRDWPRDLATGSTHFTLVIIPTKDPVGLMTSLKKRVDHEAP